MKLDSTYFDRIRIRPEKAREEASETTPPEKIPAKVSEEERLAKVMARAGADVSSNAAGAQPAGPALRPRLRPLEALRGAWLPAPVSEVQRKKIAPADARRRAGVSIPVVIEAPVKPDEIEDELAASLQAMGRLVGVPYAA